MRTKRIIAIVFILLLFCWLSWTVGEIIKPEVLPVGSELPMILCQNPDGDFMLGDSPAKETIVVYFHPDCPHCLPQLQDYNRHIDEFTDTQFYFLTSDKQFFRHPRPLGTENLWDRSHIKWGIISKSDAREKLGCKVTPVTLVFDRVLCLENKVSGEVKVVNNNQMGG
jgi:hypothetical protein